MTATKSSAGGWCGVWVSLLGGLTGQEKLNATPFSHLTFFVKGLVPNQDSFVLKLADPTNSNGKVLGPVQNYIAASTNEWQQVLVPLTEADALGLDLTELTTFSIQFTADGTYQIYLDDLYFLSQGTQAVPVSGPQDEPLQVETFDIHNVNALGGYFHALEKAPSTARVTKNWTERRGPHGKSWQITASKEDTTSWCGAWMHLLDWDSGTQRIYQDVTNYNFLTFWVKGAVGGESFTIKLADRRWMEEVDDAVPAGPVANFVPANGITTNWQQSLRRSGPQLDQNA